MRLRKKTAEDAVVSLDTLPELVDKLMTADAFAFDTEVGYYGTDDSQALRINSDNDDAHIVCITICIKENDQYCGYHIPIWHRLEQDVFRNIPVEDVVDALTPIFSRTDVKIIGHNLAYDMHVLQRIGLSIATADLEDTCVMGFLLNCDNEKALKKSVQREFGDVRDDFNATRDVPSEVKKLFGYKATQKVPCSLVELDKLAKYAVADSIDTFRLYDLYSARLQKREREYKCYTSIYKPFIRVLYNMEERGILVDKAYLAHVGERISADMDTALSALYKIAGVQFNVASREHLQALLFAHVKEGYQEPKPNKKGEVAVNLKTLAENSFCLKSVAYTDGGAPSTDAASLAELAKLTPSKNAQKRGVEFVKALLAYSKFATLDKTFIRGNSQCIYKDGRVHTHFNIVGAVTGRLSSSGPNMQNLPRNGEDKEDDPYNIRALYIAPKGYKIIAAD